MDRFQGHRISYPYDFIMSIKIKNQITEQISMGIFNKTCSYGVIAIIKNGHTHCNAIYLDHLNKIIEIFEPYGSRSKHIQLDKNIDERIAMVINKFYDSNKYDVVRFFKEGHLGPQSNDPIGTGYCGAWCLYYLESKKNNPSLFFLDNGLTFDFIKSYAELLYVKYSEIKKQRCIHVIKI